MGQIFKASLPEGKEYPVLSDCPKQGAGHCSKPSVLKAIWHSWTGPQPLPPAVTPQCIYSLGKQSWNEDRAESSKRKMQVSPPAWDPELSPAVSSANSECLLWVSHLFPPIPSLKRSTILTRYEGVFLVGTALLCVRCCFRADVDVHVPAEWRCAFPHEFEDLCLSVLNYP